MSVTVVKHSLGELLVGDLTIVYLLGWMTRLERCAQDRETSMRRHAGRHALVLKEL
jgi:hypothetical protein